ncbi:hypothetical protein NPIL_4571 [Nephila pilipes]|uniref:Uncharacterized protein n=1 Tax=Nephila pilipes TaxID=299642 RepID=A0A8X6NEV0_NEPPI|nr:hypothetical protein NPIL_4571 [Nephila pilipes]
MAVKGSRLGNAVNLSNSLCKFPQECLRADRLAAYCSTYNLQSLKFEYQNASHVLAEESKKALSNGVCLLAGGGGQGSVEKIPENDRTSLYFFGAIDCQKHDLAVKDRIELIEREAAGCRQHSFSRPLPWYCHDSIILQGNLLRQLSPQDQLSVFKGMMKGSIEMHTKIFCLSIMSSQQLEEVIKNEASPVFIALCNWPNNLYFAEMSECFFSFFSKKEFLLLLEVICEQRGFDWNDRDYAKLFYKLWNKIPDSCKHYVENSFASDVMKEVLHRCCSDAL